MPAQGLDASDEEDFSMDLDLGSLSEADLCNLDRAIVPEIKNNGYGPAEVDTDSSEDVEMADGTAENIAGPSTRHSDPVKIKRPHGRPRKTQDSESTTEKRPRGRPRLTNKSPTPTIRRPVGRPKKQTGLNIPLRRIGEVGENGRLLVRGTIPKVNSSLTTTESGPSTGSAPLAPANKESVLVASQSLDSSTMIEDMNVSNTSIQETASNMMATSDSAHIPSSESLFPDSGFVTSPSLDSGSMIEAIDTSDIQAATSDSNPSDSAQIPSSESAGSSMLDSRTTAPVKVTAAIVDLEDPYGTLHERNDQEDDGFHGMLGEGLCDESAAIDDDPDQGDDDPDPEISDAGDGPRRQKPAPKRHPDPPWLKASFQEKVNECKNRVNGVPPLYHRHQTFWWPQPSRYFLLQSNNISPEQLYDRKMFLWDPLALFSIPCPKCSKQLTRHRVIPFPRRCVDIAGTFWMIGYRYRCGTCVNPKSNLRTITFQSWDSRILKILPRTLALEFPAILTRRSAISISTFNFMRSCFQNGMGSKQFSDALRAHHLQSYDTLQLQYLYEVARRSEISQWRGEKKFSAVQPFSDSTPEGFHGFVPSGKWLRDVYDKFIEEHSHFFHQHTAQLTGEIIAIDHSHKITKQVLKINGTQVFIGLLTVTNEKGEIPLMNMRESLVLYGHEEPKVAYTDNMADKAFLEKCFPSLRSNVIPIEKYSYLEPLQIPDLTQVFVRKDSISIDNAVQTIFNSFGPDDESTICVGFDAEWNVYRSDSGFVSGRGHTALIQIAHEDRVYIFQVGSMIAEHKLPPLLLRFLQNPKVLKAGRNVTADLKYLQKACNSSKSFCGAVELAKLAKERLLIKSARLGLADLCAEVLGKRLNKNVSERLNSDWESESLTDKQKEYAALDAYASLQLYQTIIAAPVPMSLPEHLEPLTPVILFHTDKARPIARGVISPECCSSIFDGISVIAARTVIEVQEVLVPAAIITTHYKKSLEDFGPAPFNLVCLRSHLRVLPPTPAFNPPACDPSDPGLEQSDESPSFNFEALSGGGNDEIPEGESTSAGELLFDALTAEDDQSDQYPEFQSSIAGSLMSDPSSKTEANKIDTDTSNWDTVIRSRVLKDIFHIFKMIYIPRGHGLRYEFAEALRDAIFIPDKEDKQRIVAWASALKPPVEWKYLLKYRARWLWRHCKRIVPPADRLYPLVARVFKVYGPLQDAKTQVPLFNSSAWSSAKNILENIKNGHVSDPPGIALYFQIGVDGAAGGLPIYRCMRGTNWTEGGVHTHLLSRLPTSGVSIRHLIACLIDFILRHNLLVGTFNSTGKPFLGHTSIWTTHEIQEMLILLEDVLVDVPQMVGWVNGNLYKRTKEVSGVLPIPEDVRLACEIRAFDPALDSKQPYAYLAKVQGTAKPVLPIHCPEERAQFLELMKKHPDFNSPTSDPNWVSAVKVWNRLADTQPKLTYKVSLMLVEQLRAYHAGDWAKVSNIRQSLALTADARKSIRTEIADPGCSKHAPAAPECSLTLHSAPKGFLELPINTDIEMQTVTHEDSTRAIQGSAQESTETEPTSAAAGPSTRVLPANRSIADQLAVSRAVELSYIVPVQRKERKKRACAKCGKVQCNGKQNRVNCRSPCQDCGSKDCRGRNTKQTGKTCFESRWDD
ncbi:hypothetical protein C8J56DRAFT_1052609 [Mycena floridula]|nr:hypothetical protein C8J56DRAFT_1052609 [Mycena floridula]